jgi:hypothetical protein
MKAKCDERRDLTKVNDRVEKYFNAQLRAMWWQVKLLIEAPVNGGRNYNGPKVAKFLVG